MTAYRIKFNFAALPASRMEWIYEDSEQADMENFSSPFCIPSPGVHSLSALSVMTLSGGDINPVHANLHRGGNFHPEYPAQIQTFLRGPESMPWQYCHMRTPHPTQQTLNQFDHEMDIVYHQSPSPISDIFKHDEDNFLHLHHPTPAYLPPNSFLLSSLPMQHSLFPHPNGPPTPIKQEVEEYMDQASEFIMSPLPTAPETIEEFMSQEIDQDDESDQQQPDPNYPDEAGEGGLLNSQDPVNDDIDSDKALPYAVLIHRALMSTPMHRMVLADIYKYFREKIPRFKKMKGRGWMNSIRHNLSMNGAFLKEDRPLNDPGKGYIWVLSEEAVRRGVKSTTRYRKSPPNSKKRTPDNIFLQSSMGKRRRKSSRKWATAKSRSHSQTTIVKIESHERDLTHPTTPALRCGTSSSATPASTFVDVIEHNPDVGDTFQCPRGAVEYANCYPSFAHYGTSNTIYNSEEDDWHFSGPGPGDQFSEEYTLVTQNQHS